MDNVPRSQNIMNFFFKNGQERRQGIKNLIRGCGGKTLLEKRMVTKENNATKMLKSMVGR